MKTYKYTDSTNIVVHIFDADGKSRSSCLASILDVDTVIEPADKAPLPTYQELRRAAYPPMSDYLDSVVKGDVVQQQSYIDACLAVKARYPK